MKALLACQPKMYGLKQANFVREIPAGKRQQGRGECLGSSIHRYGRERDTTHKEQALEQLDMPLGTSSPKTDKSEAAQASGGSRGAQDEKRHRAGVQQAGRKQGLFC